MLEQWALLKPRRRTQVEGAVVGMAVSDSATVGLVEERRRPPLLPSMALLENEVLPRALTEPAHHRPPRTPNQLTNRALSHPEPSALGSRPKTAECVC